MTLALILLCVALLLVTLPGPWPMSPNACAFVLTLIALLIIVGAWTGIAHR